MKLHAFRISNFRSIKDTGFRELSADNITLIIGQNESGKSSILEALNTFSTVAINDDDLRSDGSIPEIICIFKTNKDELRQILGERQLPKNFIKAFEKIENCISLKLTWDLSDLEKPKMSLENQDLIDIFDYEPDENNSDPNNPYTEEQKVLTQDEFLNLFLESIPSFNLFEDNSLLPRKIDLDDIINKNAKADGYIGALNYLKIIGLDIKTIQGNKNIRIIENTIANLNKNLTAEFKKYWTQKIGKTEKISLLMELKHHDNSVPEKQGKPYLAFWIQDGDEKLHPDQRSKGVRWFLSFYLQLEARAKQADTIFLIDEPGSNLHAKAQEDILKVFEKLKNNLQIIFTTHSPYLLDSSKIYRILATQRENDQDDSSDTKVISYLNLGSASADTLLPLYSNMGVDVSHQNVISKKNNVLLEEISAFFYFKAFCKLFNQLNETYFLPSTGCSNIPLLANLLLGWGIDFIVLVDDESSGRRVLKNLEENKVRSKEKLLKIDDCNGIEDLFSQQDFKTLLLNKDIKITQKNSEYCKKNNISKPILARNFFMKVMDGEITEKDFSEESKEKILSILNKIAICLASEPS